MTIAHQYFADHPEARDGVMKAYYAYHAPHFRLTTDGHCFTSELRTNRCRWCGRTREQVRWDDLPPTCESRPDLPDVAECIEDEERKAWRLLDKAKTFVPAFVAKRGLSDETLAILHHTHGFDAETVYGALERGNG